MHDAQNGAQIADSVSPDINRIEYCTALTIQLAHEIVIAVLELFQATARSCQIVST